MKLSTIKLALSGEISTDVLRMEMQDEMSEYKAMANLKGSTMPVYVNEDMEVKIGENDLKALCTA